MTSSDCNKVLVSSPHASAIAVSVMPYDGSIPACGNGYLFYVEGKAFLAHAMLKYGAKRDSIFKLAAKTWAQRISLSA